MIKTLSATVSVLLLASASAQAANVKVTVTNNADADGTYLTPAWVGFHDGSFDTFDAGSAASAGLESIAEVGDPSGLSAEFAGSGTDGVVGAGPFGPGMSVTEMFSLSDDGSNDYLNFASMVLPSSDFFIGNDDPMAISIAGVLDGSVKSVTYTVFTVWDAGTEVNDFETVAPPIPDAGLFTGLGLPPSNPPAGADENGVISAAAGSDYTIFLNVGGADVSGLDFDNYASIATVTVSAVPIPAALPLLLTGASVLGLVGMRRKG